ncbi:LuxR C-terminal-related transcriptional regulator [Microbacterium fluvii]|uniref:LuxR C-terminal-related transcriptional regulator n=1 Tax=Microbacterium fluvii TaxID=415215 RepID=A0ABW2HGS1_9MICO|nr:LuxR C-terminal-related transcriptional regulator [Microbacterium fluvii]MCU4672840.1 LuxR C-terminal-related transcriptional regulator [Microbacterium fluvii]
MDRPSLRAALDAGLEAPLSLLVAPVGAGKSVLLAQWAATLGAMPVAWVDITGGDADPIEFTDRLIDALRAAVPSLALPGVPVASVVGRLGEPFLHELADCLAEAGALVVVFDDLHHLGGTEVLADLWRLVDLLPPGIHFVFSSRVDLRLGWSGLRLRHGLVELRQRELAFDSDVAAEVIRRIGGVEVASEALAAVMERTEGWAAGVQLTALGLRHHSDPDQLVEAIAETDRLVVDYLGEEVMDRLPDERLRALVRLAVPDELTGPLVSEVARVPDGAGLLEALERESMFLAPVPGQPGVYRFHRLFRDLLTYRLRAGNPALERELLLRTAAWHRRDGDRDAAVECLLRAHAWDQVLDELLAAGRDVYEAVRTPRLARWLGAVPADARAKRPVSDVLRGIAEGMAGHAATCIDVLGGALASDGLGEGERQAALAYRAVCVQFLPDAEFFVAAAERALAELAAFPDAQTPDLLGLTARPYLEMVAWVALGRARFFQGDLDAARVALRTGLQTDAADYLPYRVHALGSLALVDAFAGHLLEAESLAEEAVAIGRDVTTPGHPAPADAFLARSVIAAQRGAHASAAADLAEGWRCATANNRTQLQWIAHLIAEAIALDGDAPAAQTPPGPPPSVVDRALRSLRAQSGGAGTRFGLFGGRPLGAPPAAAPEPLLEPLTARECEILVYLPTRLTVAEVGARCFVSSNTVKTHLAHIYRKLGVATRDEAIRRAYELDLLDPGEIVHAG